MISKIFEIEELDKLENCLLTQDEELCRGELFASLLKYADYKNVSDWNKAVRICESLTILGWGEYEPVQAVRSVFFNGNPETSFRNRFSEHRFVNAIWSKRKNGYTMEQDRAWYHGSPHVIEKDLSSDFLVKEDIQDIKLQEQRNWILKTPILITRSIANCYKESKAVIESIDNDLQKALDLRMKPENYGGEINRIVFLCSYSYYDHDHNKTNHIIADESLKLKQKDFYAHLLTMYSKEVIEKEGYFLRNRYEFGNFVASTGRMRININFEKALGDLNYREQKQKIAHHIVEALDVSIEKLKKKKLDYNFQLMRSHFIEIMDEWVEKKL